MADAIYTPLVYMQQGGGTMVVAASGTIKVETGGAKGLRVPVLQEETARVTENLGFYQVEILQRGGFKLHRTPPRRH